MSTSVYHVKASNKLEFAKSLTYAQDTSTSVSAANIEEVKRKVEIDVNNVLRFMASNGLVANPDKTPLIFLNNNY